MTAGQPVEPGARQMESPQQFDAAGSGIDHRLLGLAYFEKGEGGAATREAIAHQHHRPLGARQNLLVDPGDLGKDRGALGYEPVDFTLNLHPSNSDFGLGRLCVRSGAGDVAAIGRSVAERD